MFKPTNLKVKGAYFNNHPLLYLKIMSIESGFDRVTMLYGFYDSQNFIDICNVMHRIEIDPRWTVLWKLWKDSESLDSKDLEIIENIETVTEFCWNNEITWSQLPQRLVGLVGDEDWGKHHLLVEAIKYLSLLPIWKDMRLDKYL